MESNKTQIPSKSNKTEYTEVNSKSERAPVFTFSISNSKLSSFEEVAKYNWKIGQEKYLKK